MTETAGGSVADIAGVPAFRVATAGPALASERDATDLLGLTYGTGADWIVIPVSRLTDDFFRLRTGVAGAFLQKLRTYGFRVAIVGDIAAHLAASSALRDFVRESNAVGQVIFANDDADLSRRLAKVR